MNREFYWEYSQECDELTKKFCRIAKEHHENIFKIGEMDMEKPVSNFIWEKIFFSHDKDTYSKLRLQGQNYNEIIKKIWLEKIVPLLNVENTYTNFIINNSSKLFSTLLEPHIGSIIFYCKNNRQLQYYLPILKRINIPTVILSLDDINELDLTGLNIQIIQYELIYQELFINSGYLEYNFPYIFYLVNTLFFLLDKLSPRRVVLLEGCHFETEVVSAICKFKKITSLCLQQGWPSLMHTRFTNMSYDYFLTWGKGFSDLWSTHNQTLKMEEVGYPYPIALNSYKTGIAFFFQAPLYIIDNALLESMFEFFIFCSNTYPDRKVYIREHPEYKLGLNKISELGNYKNIEVVTDWQISDVFSKSEIGVSIFSSTLMEGIIHETIPFVFNLTSSPGYYPNVEKEGIGIEVRSLNEARTKMDTLIKCENNLKAFIKNNINKKKHYYFKNTGEESIMKIVDIICRK